MPSTKDLDVVNSPVKILFVSKNGTGKSIAASSFFKAGPILVDDADIRMKPVAAYFPGEDIKYYSWTTQNFKGFVHKIHSIIDGTYKPDYKTWVIDSMTSFSTTCVVYQLNVKGNTRTTKGGMPATSWDEINGETVFFHEMLEAANILYEKFGVNIIWTAHPIAKTEGMGEDSRKITSLAAYGIKIPDLVPGFFDEIYSLSKIKTSVGGYSTIVKTQPDEKEGTLGKTALFDYLPDSFDITDKNFYEVWRSFLGKKKE